MDNQTTVAPSDPQRGTPGSSAAAVVRSEAASPGATWEHACVISVFTMFRRPVFRDPRAAHAVAAQLARTLPRDRAAWLAWVLMPDHWQGLLACGRDESLPALVGRFKAMTTRAVDPRLRINGWLWGRGHRHAPLAEQESLGDAARILVSAPRRGGLVDRVADYPYWASAWDPRRYADEAERDNGGA